MQAFHLDTVDSTNEVAKRLIAEGRLNARGYVLAREQTSGRGQRGRVWVSPPDAGIYLSVVDRPSGGDPDLSLYTRAAGVACASVLSEATGLDIRIKPVNDLYVEGRKLGGILTEAMIEYGTLRALITGIGINTRAVPRDVHDALVAPISLQDLLSPQQFAFLDTNALAARIAQKVIQWNVAVAGGDLERLHAQWRHFRVDERDFIEARSALE